MRFIYIMELTLIFQKLSVESSWKCFIIKISDNKDLLMLLLYHVDHNSNHCTLKATKSKTRYKTALGSNIYAKLPACSHWL